MTAHFILSNFIFVYFVLIIGYLLNRNIFKISSNESLTLLLGIIYISFIGLLSNFFLPLSKNLNTLLLILILTLGIKNYNFFLKKKIILFVITISIINILLLLGSNHYRPDAFVYHLPYIATLNEEKIIFGLNNVNYRFGHTSVIQYFAALFNNYIFGINGLSLYMPIVFSSYVYLFLVETYKNKKNILGSISFFFLCIALLKMHRASEFGNDYWAHFYFILGFYLILRSNFKNKLLYSDFFKITLIFLFSFLNKIFFSLTVFFIIYLLIKYKKYSFIKNKENIFAIFFLVIFFVKNIIITGCLVYPIEKTCFNKLAWTAGINDYGYAKNIELDSEAWSKDWPNYFKHENSLLTQDEYISDFNWLTTWSENHLIIILKKLFPILIFLLIFILTLKRDFLKTKKILDPYLFYICTFFFILWFIKFPLYRFGLSILITFIFCIYFYILEKTNYKLLDFKKSIFILMICIFVALVQNTKKIITNYESLIPELSSKNNCGLKSLCSNYDNLQNISLQKFIGYKIYKIKN